MDPRLSASEWPLRIGLALGAGSAPALAEIGAVEALAEAGIPIHCVAGTSAGAVVGAAYASGRIAELRERLSELTWPGVVSLFDPAWPRQGLLRGLRGLEFIRQHLGARIEELPVGYAAVATDLANGDEVWLRSGSVFDAVRASIAIPGIFTPWRIDGRLLVDGGLVDPVPVAAARALGAEFVIAINVLPLREKTDPATLTRKHLRQRGAVGESRAEVAAGEQVSLVEVVLQASRILASQVASARLRAERPEFLLQLDVPGVNMFDLHRTAELAESGRRAALEALPRLERRLRRALPLSRRIARTLRRGLPVPRP